MQVTSLGGEVLTGLSSTGMALPVGPMGGDASIAPGDNVVPAANPGTGLLAEASEPLPPHIDTGGPAAIAAPAPSAGPTASGGGTGEPPSMYDSLGVTTPPGA